VVPAGATSTTTISAYTAPAYGQTAAEITAGFPAQLAQNFATNPNLSNQIVGMTPILSRMSSELLALDHSGYTAENLKSAAQRVSAADLRMLQSAFGPTLMAAALPYAPAATLAAYNALPAQAPLPFSA